MIPGPFPVAADGMHTVVPIDGPYLTPLYRGERVALRLTEEDRVKATRGCGLKGTITDLDTGIRYRLHGAACSLPRCFCDAVIEDL